MAYITKAEAAARLCIGMRTLEGIIARGQLRAYRIGPKLVRIDEDELEDYVRARLVAPVVAAKTQRRCGYVPGMKVV